MDCPVCLELFTEKIYQCVNGHTVCPNCKSRLIICPTCLAPITDTRNYFLESFIADMYVQCENAEAGCIETIQGTYLKDHKKACPFRKYSCQICEKWSGRKIKLEYHIRQEHKDKWDAMNPLHFQMNVNDLNARANYRYLSVFDELFLLRSESMNGNVSWIVYYIGPTKRASKFFYEIEIVSRISEMKKWKCSELCVKDTLTDNEVIESGCYISIPCSTFSRFADKDKKTYYKLTVGMNTEN